MSSDELLKIDNFVSALHHLKCAEAALLRLHVVSSNMTELATGVKAISDVTLKTWKDLYEGEQHERISRERDHGYPKKDGRAA